MLNIRKWCSKICPTPDPRPAGEVPPAATHDAELDYWWLLPGDVCLTPPAAAPKAAGE
ncbi:MAG: hypothetical protein U1B81_15905 [Arthrobacter sp.]|nr:hypothetical protein [Arthrobacter sp.]